MSKDSESAILKLSPIDVRSIIVKKKKKSKRILHRFFTVFFKSIFIMAGLFLTAFASYKITLLYYNNFGGPSDNKVTDIVNELYGEVEVTDVSKNLIYAMGDDGKLKAVVLEIFNTNTHNMDYITIPMKSEFTLSNDMYQKLYSSGCDVPQIMKLSHLTNYFTGKTMYKYGTIMIEDLLGIDISYYTVVPVQKFKVMFKQRDAALAYDSDGNPMQSYYEWKIKKTFVKKISGLDEEAFRTYVKELATFCESDLNTKSKLEYADDYAKVTPELLYTHSLYGSLTNDDFVIDKEESRQLVQNILSNASYTQAQVQAKTSDSAQSSAGCIIEILNASQINGLAASYQTKLTDAGYTVASVGNYTGELAAQTRILVSKEGIGTDLLSFFQGAVVEKADLPYGCDIQVVLGTDANNQP
ncbi:MAG: hypothetical protein PWP24_874 [Clostridiales bacterium]|nr:hypothetical protein [Clostridiales bacterium]